MEFTKFESRKKPYREGLAEILKLGFTVDDYIHHNPSFAGHMNISRFLALYEAYKQTLGLAGHIAEVGVYKASSLLFFAKLTQIFEPEAITLCHGFDWFQGMVPGADELTDKVRDLWAQEPDCKPMEREPSVAEEVSYEKIKKLIDAQNLGHIAHLHKLDVTKELGAFFERNPHMQFKLVFFDAGTYEVTSSCLPHFWPRLIKGGILILDQFNHEIAPGETRAIKEFLPDVEVRNFVFTRMPTAYIVKP